jgi:HAD superfamily hydrolase (TIGR01662 family)
MTGNLIRAVLFDLGGTLMYARDPWPPIFEAADLALAESLCAQGLQIDCGKFPRELRARLNQYYLQREQDHYETTYLFILRELLEEKGVQGTDDEILRPALDCMYAVTQSNWLIEDDALLTLRLLESAGYRLGLVSNAGDNKDVFQLVERFGLEPYFDFILTSAACSYRKPHPRIFELALAHWGISPREAVMVGDNLLADIQGAHDAGLYAIYVRRRAGARGEEIELFQPDGEVSALAQIPYLLSELSPT